MHGNPENCDVWNLNQYYYYPDCLFCTVQGGSEKYKKVIKEQRLFFHTFKNYLLVIIRSLFIFFIFLNPPVLFKTCSQGNNITGSGSKRHNFRDFHAWNMELWITNCWTPLLLRLQHIIMLAVYNALLLSSYGRKPTMVIYGCSLSLSNP